MLNNKLFPGFAILLLVVSFSVAAQDDPEADQARLRELSAIKGELESVLKHGASTTIARQQIVVKVPQSEEVRPGSDIDVSSLNPSRQGALAPLETLAIVTKNSQEIRSAQAELSRLSQSP